MKVGKIVIVIILLSLLFVLTQSEPRRRGRHAKRDISGLKERMGSKFTVFKSNLIMYMFFGGLFGIAALIESYRRALKNKKDKLLEEIYSMLKQIKPEPSDFPENERNSIIYNITYSAMKNIQFTDEEEKEYTCKPRQGKSQEITRDMYSLEFKANDLKGQSKIQGVIIFSNTGLKLKLCKVYEHIELSQILGSFKAYIFEGQGNGKEISGQWRKYGQQNRSGTFKMLRD